jgi:hypothetical protein
MSSPRTEYDVFLSYSQRDRALADDVAERLAQAGVSAFKWQDAVTPGTSLNTVLLNALAESAAMIVIAAADDLINPNLLFEIGAAMSWQKPIYVVYSGDKAPRAGFSAHSITIIPIRKLDSVVRLLHHASQPLTDRQIVLLRRAYAKLGIPTDVLLTNPAAIDKFTREFNRLSQTNLSVPRLLRELLRLRKQKGLPPLKRTARKQSP